MKILLFSFILTLLNIKTLARTERNLLLERNKFSLGLSYFDQNYYSNQMRASIPPLLRSKENFLTIGMGYSHTFMKTNLASHKYQSFSINPFYKKTISKNWSFESLLPLSFSAKQKSNLINSKTLNILTIQKFTKRFKHSKVSFGLALAKRAKKYNSFPILSYQYFNKDYPWLISSGFPNLLNIKRIFNKFTLGSFVNYQSQNFFIGDDTYLRARIWSAGLNSHIRITSNLFTSLQLAKVFKDSFNLVDERDEAKSFTLYRPKKTKINFKVHLGYRF